MITARSGPASAAKCPPRRRTSARLPQIGAIGMKAWPPSAQDRRRDRRGAVAVDVGNADNRAFGGQMPGDPLAQPAPRAGDQDRLACRNAPLSPSRTVSRCNGCPYIRASRRSCRSRPRTPSNSRCRRPCRPACVPVELLSTQTNGPAENMFCTWTLGSPGLNMPRTGARNLSMMSIPTCRPAPAMSFTLGSHTECLVVEVAQLFEVARWTGPRRNRAPVVRWRWRR